MPRVTDYEEKIRKLREFYSSKGRAPGYEEMLKIFKYRSKNSVHGLLRRLSRMGVVGIEPGGKLVLGEKIRGTVRLLGLVQAGFPSPAEEELVDLMSLDEFLISRPDATYMLTVTGDSMIDAGIQPGDLVLVEKGIKPKKGDIVVAQVDGEWTLKYFSKDAKGVRLDPANPKYSTIRPKNSLVLGGVVKAVIRKYT